MGNGYIHIGHGPESRTLEAVLTVRGSEYRTAIRRVRNTDGMQERSSLMEKSGTTNVATLSSATVVLAASLDCLAAAAAGLRVAMIGGGLFLERRGRETVYKREKDRRGREQAWIGERWSRFFGVGRSDN